MNLTEGTLHILGLTLRIKEINRLLFTIYLM